MRAHCARTLFSNLIFAKNIEDTVPSEDNRGDQHPIFFWPGRGSGTLMKPKYHFMGVGGLLVQELETSKNLKAAEKRSFLGQNEVLHFGHYFLWVKDRENPSIPACSNIHT